MSKIRELIEKMNKIREKYNLSEFKIGKECGLSRPTVRKILNFEGTGSNLQNFEKLSNYLFDYEKK